ncbi:hypothetical protein D3C73_1398710 [compost metagenome]
MGFMRHSLGRIRYIPDLLVDGLNGRFDFGEGLPGRLYRMNPPLNFLLSLCHHRNRLAGFQLNRTDNLGPPFPGFGCLLGQLAHLIRHYGESPAVLARSRRFDCRI